VKPNRSLFSLVTFCAASGLVIALGLAVLIATVTAGFAVGTLRSSASDVVLASTSASATGQEAETMPTANLVTVAGLITDDHCGARHDRRSGMTASQCAQMCVRNGSGYSLVNGDKRYALEGHAAELNKLAGERATISGSLAGDTIKVSSIASP